MLPDPASSGNPRSLITASAVFLILFSAYTLTYQGTFRVDDEHILAARSQSLALWGRLEQPQVFGNERERELQPMGDAATQIEPGQALIGAALYRVAAGLGLGGTQSLFVQNALLTAATGAVLALSVAALGFTASSAAAVGLLFGLGTYAWPYATTYFRDPQAMFGIALAIHGWVRITRPGTRVAAAGWTTLLAGIAIGATAKNAALVLVPAIAAVLPLALRTASPSVRRRWIAWSSGAVLVGLALLLLPKPGPLARFTLDYYLSVGRHSLSGLELATVIEGTLGPFVSPAQSLFLFCPPLFLLLAVPRRWWREQGAIVGVVLLTAVGLALGQVLFYREQWAGAVGWGPRPMLLVLPGLMLLIAPAVDRLSTGARNRWTLAGIGTLAYAVQLSAVLIPWQSAHESIRALGLEAYTYTGAWDIRRLLPFYQMPMLASVKAWSTAWSRLASAGSGVWVLPVATSGLGLAAGWLIMRARRVLPAIGVTILVSLGLLMSAAVAWASDPSWHGGVGEIDQAISYAEAQAGGEDVVLLDAYGTPAWFRMMNEWSKPVRWYSLPFEIPGTEGGSMAEPQADVVRLLEELLAGGGHVWLIASSDAPDYLTLDERTWLEHHAALVGSRSFFEGSRRVDVLTFEPR
jgi:hypothetical protein